MSEIEEDPQQDTQQYPHSESVPLNSTPVPAANLSGSQFVSDSMNTSEKEFHTMRPSMSHVQKKVRIVNQDKQPQNPKGSYSNANATNFSQRHHVLHQAPSFHHRKYDFLTPAISSSLNPNHTIQCALSDINNTSQMKSANWQSANDIAERKIILKAVFHVIKIFQDALNINYDRLSIIAKIIEKYLYRCAISKEEYMDISTLRQRIQTLSLTLRCLSATDQHKTNHESSRQIAQEQSFVRSNNTTNKSNSAGEKNDAKRQRLAQTSLLSSGPYSLKSANSTLTNKDSHEKSVDFNSRIIEKQQKRLILLRHARKCTEKNCTVKYCKLMVKLWSHMKACDDKDCNVRHCFSSKCILNHYRICKDTDHSATCKVCAPVRNAGEAVLMKNEKATSDPLCCLAEMHEIEPLPFIERNVSGSLSLERKEYGLNEKNLLLDFISGMKDFQDIIDPNTKLHKNDSSVSLYSSALGGKIDGNVIFPQSSLFSSDCRGYDGNYFFYGDVASESTRSLGDSVVDDNRHLKVEKPCNKMISDTMLPIVNNLINHEFGWVFKNPVDPVELCLPDYFRVVSEPMDLNSIKERLLKLEYSDVGECSRDIRKVFENAILYNGKDSDVGMMALQMIDAFSMWLCKIDSAKIVR